MREGCVETERIEDGREGMGGEERGGEGEGRGRELGEEVLG